MKLNRGSSSLLCAALFIASAQSHKSKRDLEFSETKLNDLKAKWDSDFPSTAGINSFAHLPYYPCLITPMTADIFILGMPFDTAVSYRPGARFGPQAIRAASGRQTSFRGYNPRAKINPYQNWASIVDCGSAPITPFDNALALRQMSEAYMELGTRPPADRSSAEYRQKPKIITLGGDHSIALPALRALQKIHGSPISVVHFDAHLDTWHPAKYPSKWLEDHPGDDVQSHFNHGSMFWIAANEGLIANGSSVHAGLRTRLSGDDEGDYDDDDTQGWSRITCDDIDDIGAKGIIERIISHVGYEKPVYLSVDIDVLDPGLASGTGTPEPGGWTTRELIRILRGIEGLNVVGADVVEVSPTYDGPGEATALAAAQVVYEMISSIVKRGLDDHGVVSSEEQAGKVGRDEL